MKKHNCKVKIFALNLKLSLTIITLIVTSFSCSKKKEDPLIIPPNFNELPHDKDDEYSQEKNPVSNQAEIEKLKKMLQESD